MTPNAMTRAKDLLGPLGRRQDGAALVEFAIVVPILAFVAIGTFDFGLAYKHKHRLTSAAQAGAQMAAQERTLQDVKLADVEARVREEANDTANELTVTPRYYCTCFGETAEQACSADPVVVCPVGNDRPLLKYIEVDVQHSIDLIFEYPGLAAAIPVRITATTRVR